MVILPWVFLDYADDSGTNRIKAWLADLPAAVKNKVRSKFLWVIIHHAALGQPLDRDFFQSLVGTHSGLIAIHFTVKGIAYRPLCCYGARRGEVVLLAGATEHNDHYRPQGIRNTALARREEVLADGKRAVPTCLFEEIN